MAFDYVDKCLYGAPRPKSSYVASGQNHSTSDPLSVVSLSSSSSSTTVGSMPVGV